MTTKEPKNTDKDWDDNPKRPSLWRRWALGAVVVLVLLGWAYVLKWPAVIIYKITSSYFERNSMNPKEIILSNEPQNRIKNKINLPDSSFAKLSIPKKFIDPGFGYNNLYQSSINIRTNADTVGQDVIDKIYGINKTEWTLDNYSPPGFKLSGHFTASKQIRSRIEIFTEKALSISYDSAFKIIVMPHTFRSQKLAHKNLTPELLIYVPLEAERDGNVYIECPYQDNGRFCLIKDEIDQKITVESRIDRRQLQIWKMLREATRKFTMQYYVNPD